LAVIIKGGARGGARSLAIHLLRTDTNERVTVLELRGVVADELDDALNEMAAVASGAKTKRAMYHANIDSEPGQPPLTEAQKWQAIDRLETELGLTGHARAVVEHVKKGREHLHVVWSRIDLETMTAVHDGHNYRRHEIVARELEAAFGHARVQGAHIERDGERPARTPSPFAVQQGERTGFDAKEAAAFITDLWRTTDSGSAFRAALEDAGLILARGDRRVYVLIDPQGGIHSLARLIEGARTADVVTRLAETPLDDLPNVREARAIQSRLNELAAEPDTGKSGNTPAPEAPTIAADRVAGPDGSREPDEMSDGQREEFSFLSDEMLKPVAQRQQPGQQPDAAPQKRDDETAQQEPDQIALYRQLYAIQKQIDAYRAEQQQAAETAAREEEQRNQAADEARALQGDIRGADTRYSQALAQHYNVMNPYESLARAAMAEAGAFRRDQQTLDQQIARASPEARKALELKKEIEKAEYMAITDRRIASMSDVITGRMSPLNRINAGQEVELARKAGREPSEGEKHRDRAKAYTDRAAELRKQWVEVRKAERAQEQRPVPTRPQSRPGQAPQKTATQRAAEHLAKVEAEHARTKPPEQTTDLSRSKGRSHTP
jgi:Relaxase/Mobilisation nuclease domain